MDETVPTTSENSSAIGVGQNHCDSSVRLSDCESCADNYSNVSDLSNNSSEEPVTCVVSSSVVPNSECSKNSDQSSSSSGLFTCDCTKLSRKVKNPENEFNVERLDRLNTTAEFNRYVGYLEERGLISKLNDPENAVHGTAVLCKGLELYVSENRRYIQPIAPLLIDCLFRGLSITCPADIHEYLKVISNFPKYSFEVFSESTVEPRSLAEFVEVFGKEHRVPATTLCDSIIERTSYLCGGLE